MRLIITIFLAFSLTLPFISPSLISTSSFEDDDGYVHDIQGNYVRYANQSYDTHDNFTYPEYTLTGGPFCGKCAVFARNNGSTCNYDIIQHFFFRIYGSNFSFLPPNGISPEDTRIKLGAPLVIQSPTTPNLCLKSSIWNVSSDTGIAAPIITIGGMLNTSSSCFRIVKPEKPVLSIYSYKIQHCPYLCGSGSGSGSGIVVIKQCYDVGVYETSDGYKHLGTNVKYLELVMNNVYNSTKFIPPS